MFALVSKCKLRYLFIPPSVTKIIEYSTPYDFSGDYILNEDIIIFGEKGSAAERFAKKDYTEYDVNFIFKTCDSSKKQIILTEDQVSLSSGNKYKLYAISIPSYKMIPVTWKSSNESILSIKDGNIVAKKIGTAKVTAFAKDYLPASCNVVVNKI